MHIQYLLASIYVHHTIRRYVKHYLCAFCFVVDAFWMCIVQFAESFAPEN